MCRKYYPSKRQLKRSECSPAVRPRGRSSLRWRRSVARPQRALHQDAVYPASELEAGGAQHADAQETERGVQVDRSGVCAVADHRDDVAIAERFATLDQRAKQRAAYAAAFEAVAHVNRILERIPVSGATAIRGAVAVAGDHAAEVGGEVRQAAAVHVVEAPAHFLEGGRLLLERGEAVQHVVRVDRMDSRQIFGASRPHLQPLTENTRAPRGPECASRR